MVKLCCEEKVLYSLQLVVKRDLLWNHADTSPDCCRALFEVVSSYCCAAIRNRSDCGEHLYSCGSARESRRFPLVYFEGDVIYCQNVSKSLCQIVYLNYGIRAFLFTLS